MNKNLSYNSFNKKMTSVKNTNRNNTKPNYSRNQSRYIREFNRELDMDIYFTPKSIPDKNLYSCDKLYKKEFIIKILKNYLWKYPIALREFSDYISNIYDNNNDSIWIDINFYKDINSYYKIIRDKYNIQSNLGDTNGSNDRGDNRMKSIEKYIINKQPKCDNYMAPSCYLDIGCFDGSITQSIAKYFGINKSNTHGVDIKSCNNSNITFTQYDGKILPYDDNSFDLITCLMVLHHIPDDNISILLSEINRVMKPNGVLILREHDVNINNERTLLDIMHYFYDYVWVDSYELNEMWVTNYKSHTEWSKRIISNGFVLYTPLDILNNSQLNPFLTYMCSYRKLKTLESGDNETKVIENTVYRILPNDLNREVYKNQTNEIKNITHWGQRKLLLTEIEYFTIFIKNNPDAKNIYAIYAGSAPGTHILYLSKLFPEIHFELYDPRAFSNKLLQNKEMIKTHIQYFTDNTAKKWISLDHPDKTILFISDIRTSENNNQTLEQIEECVKNDQAFQTKWYNIINPEMAMFKFRLPWNDGITTYLDGDIYIQPYPPINSTETRLIVKKNAINKLYNNRQYEEQLFYFNNRIRPLLFKNILYNINSDEKYGLSNNHDGSVEVYILSQYLQYIKKLSNEDINIESNEFKQKIIEMVGDISHELSYSRTLFSKQPISNNNKNILIKIYDLGYIPKNTELDQDAFNKYVIPRYNYFIINGIINA